MSESRIINLPLINAGDEQAHANSNILKYILDPKYIEQVKDTLIGNIEAVNSAGNRPTLGYMLSMVHSYIEFHTKFKEKVDDSCGKGYCLKEEYNNLSWFCALIVLMEVNRIYPLYRVDVDE